jgi:hypothetical protein
MFLHTSFKYVTEKVYPELYAWNIIPKPEMFTELYFENHEKLPLEIMPQKKYSFAFTIHNVENKNMVYPYTVYMITNHNKVVLQHGNISLHQDKAQTIPVNITISSVMPTSEIVVDLPKKKQSIDFWINE